MCADSLASRRLQIAISLRLRVLRWRRRELPNLQPNHWRLRCLHPWLLLRLHWKMQSKRQLLIRSVECEWTVPQCSGQLPKHQPIRLLRCLFHRVSFGRGPMHVFPAVWASGVPEGSGLHCSQWKLLNLEPYKW